MVTKEWKADVRASLACVAPSLLDALRPKITGTELLALLDDADAAEASLNALAIENLQLAVKAGMISDIPETLRRASSVVTAEEMRAALVAIGRYEIACDEHDDPHELEDARRAANKADALARRLAEEADRG